MERYPEDMPLREYRAWLQSLTPAEYAKHAIEARRRTCENCTCHDRQPQLWACPNCGCGGVERVEVSEADFDKLEKSFGQKIKPNAALTSAFRKG